MRSVRRDGIDAGKGIHVYAGQSLQEVSLSKMWKVDQWVQGGPLNETIQSCKARNSDFFDYPNEQSEEISVSAESDED